MTEGIAALGSALFAANAEMRTDAASSCLAIAEGLGAPFEGTVSSPIAPGEALEVCRAAAQRLDAALGEGASSVSRGEVTCTPLASAEAECASDCGDDSACAPLCAAVAAARGTCVGPTVTVTTDDPAIAALLEASLPPLFRAQERGFVTGEAVFAIERGVASLAGEDLADACRDTVDDSLDAARDVGLTIPEILEAAQAIVTAF